MNAFGLLECGLTGGVRLATRFHTAVTPLPSLSRPHPVAESLPELEDESRRLFKDIFLNTGSSSANRCIQQSRYYDIEARIEELKARLAEETAQREVFKETVRELDEAHAVTEAERAKLAVSLESAEKKVVEIEAQRGELSVCLDAAEKRATNFETERDELTISLEISKKDVMNVTTDRDNLRISVIEVAVERDDLHTMLVSTREEADSAIHQLCEARDELAVSLRVAETKVEEFALERGHLCSTLEEEREATELKVSQLSEQCDRLASSNRLLENDKIVLEGDLAQANGDNSHLQEELLSKALKLTLTTALLKSSRDEVSTLRERLDNSHHKVVSKGAVIDEQERRHLSNIGLLNSGILELLDVLDNELAGRFELEKELADTQGQLDFERRQAVDAKAHLQDEKDKTAALEERLQQAHNELAAQKTVGKQAIDQLRLEQELSEKLGEELIHTDLRLDDTLQSHARELKELKMARFEQTRKTTARFEDEKRKLSATIRQQQEKIAAVTSQLVAECESHSHTRETLQSRINTLIAEKEQCELVLVRIKEQHGNACDEVVRLSEISRRLSRDLKKAYEERDQLRDEVSVINSSDEDLRVMVSSLTHETATLKTSKKSVENAFAQKRDQCEVLHREVLRLTQAATSATSPFAVSTPLRHKNLNISAESVNGAQPSPIFGANRFGNGVTGSSNRSFSVSFTNFFSPQKASSDIESGEYGFDSAAAAVF